jgi:LmbE family N-acetylglucosaminyl deacetylase
VYGHRKVVLAVGAHPDDVELGCAGTLAMHKKNGDKVYLLVLTRGEASGDPAVREKECRQAAEMLGVDGLFFGGLEDTKIHDGVETIEAIEKILSSVNPDVIYTHSYKDAHQDHRNTAHATLSAGRRCNKILMFEGASTLRDFIPQVFIDVGGAFELKKKITQLFGSQLNHKSGGYASAANAIGGLARFRGYQAGVDVAEAFEVGKFILDV